MKYIPFFLFFFSITVFAQDIYLIDGQVYKNVRIVSEDSSQVTINFNNTEREIPISSILRIDRKSFKPFQPSKLENGISNDVSLLPKAKPNLIWLSVGALALLNTWDSLSDASNLDSSIDAFRKINSVTFKDVVDELESQKSRKLIIGYVSLAVAIATIYVAFDVDPVYAKLGSNSFTLSLKF